MTTTCFTTYLITGVKVGVIVGVFEGVRVAVGVGVSVGVGVGEWVAVGVGESVAVAGSVALVTIGVGVGGSVAWALDRLAQRKEPTTMAPRTIQNQGGPLFSLLLTGSSMGSNPGSARVKSGFPNSFLQIFFSSPNTIHSL